jgi:hypothetical protein
VSVPAAAGLLSRKWSSSRRTTPAPSRKKTYSASVFAVAEFPTASTTAVITRRTSAAPMG